MAIFSNQRRSGRSWIGPYNSAALLRCLWFLVLKMCNLVAEFDNTVWRFEIRLPSFLSRFSSCIRIWELAAWIDNVSCWFSASCMVKLEISFPCYDALEIVSLSPSSRSSHAKCQPVKRHCVGWLHSITLSMTSEPAAARGLSYSRDVVGCCWWWWCASSLPVCVVVVQAS